MKSQPKQTTSKGLLCRSLIPQLTKTQQEILNLLTKEYLTPRQIVIRRGTSKQAVYKIIKKLRNMGVLSLSEQKVDFSGSTSQPVNLIRLHGQEFHIKILYKDNHYAKLLKTCNLLKYEDCTIKLFKDSIEVYSLKSFSAENAQKATARSIEFWNRRFIKLENDLKIIILKARYKNIKQVNAHYAETNNEFSKDCDNNAHKVRLYTKDDGKLWFLIDNSFNLHEAEAVHPQTSKQDINKLTTIFNDIRENEAIPLSQLSKFSLESAQQIKELSSALTILVKTFNPNPLQSKPTKLHKSDYIG